MPVQGADLTLTLDELYANDEMIQWYPEQSASFKRINRASPKLINARGGRYLIELKTPQAINAADFASSDAVEFPSGGFLTFLEMTVTPITHRASFSVTSNVTAQNKGALKQKPAKNYDYVMKATESITQAYGVKQSRDMWGNRVGEIGRVSGISTNTLTLNTAANLFGSFLFENGMQVEYRDGSGTLKGYSYVKSVDRFNKNFVAELTTDPDGTTKTSPAALTSAVTTNDRIYMRGCYNNNWAGVSHFLEKTGAFQGLADRTAHYRLPGLREDKGGQTLTASMIRKMISDQEMRVNNDSVKGEFFGSTQVDAYEMTGLPTQVWGQSGETLKQGYSNLQFNSAGGGRKFTKDLYIPRDVLTLCDLDMIDKFEMQPFQPLKGDNGYFFRAWGTLAHKDFELMYFRGIGNLGCSDPSRLGVWYENLSTAGLSTGNA